MSPDRPQSKSVQAIPNHAPSFLGNEKKYLTECIDTGWVSSVGPFVDRFEDEFAQRHGVSGAVAVASGTAAIHLGLLSLGIRPGDLVLCPTLTFVATVNPILYCGAEPVFIGADQATLNIDLAAVETFLKTETRQSAGDRIHPQTGRRVGALVVAHLYGNPVDMGRALDISDRYGVPILEDAAESLGATWEARPVGTLGDVGCFSFNGNKIVTTGGGGMILARNDDRLKRCRHLSTQARTDGFEYFHDDIGFNYRLSNVSAAIGVAQLENLDVFIARKRRHADTYARLFERQGGRCEVIRSSPQAQGSYWLVLARCRASGGRPIVPLLRQLAAGGVGVRPVWQALHRLPLFGSRLYRGDDSFQALYDTVCCLPSSVGLTDDEIARVTDALTEAVS